MTYEPIKFPGWRYGPNGEAQIFEREEDVPEGWLDHPIKSKSNEPIPAESIEAVAGISPDESNHTSEGDLAAAHEDASVSLEDLKGELKGKPMSELWKMATELELEKGGKKTALIERIAQKLYANR